MCGRNLSLKNVINAGTIYPLDNVLGIETLPYEVTCDVLLRITREAVRSHSYKEAQLRLSEILPFTPSCSYIWEISNFIGYIALQEQEKRIEKLKHALEIGTLSQIASLAYPDIKSPNVIYACVDGSYLNTRPDELKAMQENISNWKECKMAMVFSPEDLIKRKPGRNGEERYTIGKSDYDAFIGSFDIFKFILLDLLIRNGVTKNTTIVLLSDGADWIYTIVTDLARAIGAEIVPINDLFHTKQNIGAFCQYINDRIKNSQKNPDHINSEESKLFKETELLDANKIIELVENGNIACALKILEPFKDIKTSKSGVVNAYNYINERKSRMDYPKYRKLGYYVGSGPGESANKYFIQNRMKGPGMEWAIICGQRMLHLRGLDLANKWGYLTELIYANRSELLYLKKQFDCDEEIRRDKKKNADKEYAVYIHNLLTELIG